MKKHQVIRFIGNLLKDRSDLKLLATIGDSSYLLWSKESAQPPNYRLLRLERDGQSLKVQSGLSYFHRAQDILLAPAFCFWQGVDMGELPARSKQHLRRSLKKVLKEFDSATHGRYELLGSSNKNVALADLHAHFVAQRFDLMERDERAVEGLKKLATSEQYSQLMRLASLGEVEREDDELESLLDSFGAEGDFSGTASFSLNQEKALQKLTDFQLGERHLFPLFLAAGLSLQGASHISIRLDSDEIWVEYQGIDITKDTLENISHSLLSATLTPGHRGLRVMGQALLQSAGHNPSALELRTGEAVFDLRGFPELDLEKLGTEAGGVFYTRLPLDLEVAKRFFSRLTGSEPEVDLLRSALRYLPTPWSLNGVSEYASFNLTPQTLAFAWTSPGVAAPDIEHTGLLYREMESSIPAHVLMLVDAKQACELVVVVDGLRVECPVGMNVRGQIYVWLSDMQTDLSGQKLVHTQLLDEVLEAVKKLQESLPVLIAKEFQELPTDERTPWQIPLLRLMAKEKSWRSGLSALECLPLVASEKWTSLSNWASDTTMLYSSEQFDRGLRSGSSVVRIEEGAVDPLRALYEECRDMTSLLHSCRTYYERFEEWLKTPTDDFNLEAASQPRVALNTHKGSLGFSPEERPSVRLMSHSRVLPVDVSHWLPPYVELVVNHDELEMDNTWRNIRTMALLESLRAEVQDALRSLVRLLRPKDFEQELVRRQMTEALKYFKRTGHSLKDWSDIKFIQETRTEMDTSGLIPVPRQVAEYYSLSERSNYLD